jgi:hypothetical protein
MTRRTASLVLAAGNVSLLAGVASWQNRLRLPVVHAAFHPVCEADAEHDLGMVEAGTTAEREFTVRNTGGRPLTVAVNRVSCYCAAVTRVLPGSNREPADGPVIIPPADSTTLAVAIRVTGATDQQLAQQIFLGTTDPDRPEVEVRFRYTVSRWFHTIPAVFNFGTVPAGQERSLDAVVMGQRGRAASVPSVGGLPPGVRAAYQPGPPPDGPVVAADATEVPVGRLRVTALAPSAGETAGEVALLFDGHRLAVPVSIRATPVVEASPAELFLPLASTAGRVHHARVLVRRADREPATLAVTAPPGVTADCPTADRPAAVHVVLLTADPARATGKLTVHCRLTARAEAHDLPVAVHVGR